VFRPPGPAAPHFYCDKPPELPLSIKSLLNQYYPASRFPDITDEDCQTVEQNGGPDAYPEVIQGDFNDDGYRDYAVLIEEDGEAHDQHVTRPLTIPMVAFFCTPNGYRRQQVTDEGGGCLPRMPKGKRDYDYDAQPEFTYQRDTIFLQLWYGRHILLVRKRKISGYHHQ